MYTFFLVLHLIGLVIGAGSALVSDVLFLGIIHDKKIHKSEFKLLNITNSLTLLGLLIVGAAGTAVLFMNDFALFQYGSFRAEFVIVLVIIINSILLRVVHMPFLNKIANNTSLDKHMTEHDVWHKFRIMFLSGAVSLVSWFMVIILSALKGGVTLGFFSIIGMYLVGLIFALGVGQVMIQHLFPIHCKSKQSPLHKGIWMYVLTLGVVAALFFAVFSFLQPRNSTGNGYDVSATEVQLTPKAELEWDTENSHVSFAPNVPPKSTHTEQRIYEVHLEVIEGVCPIDEEEGVYFETWGYRVKGEDEVSCGSPGPVLRGRVGDVVRVTLTNLPENSHPHNIDFHSVTGQHGGASDLLVVPGETASIEARLLYPGAFMYHCAYGDVPVHISRGMYGMFIVDPETPMPEVDHEWAIMQSEWYLTDPDENGLTDFDYDNQADEEPDYITFNGKVGALVGEGALNMSVGERARIYFVNEGLDLNSNFHPIGSHWDVVYPEAATHESNNVIRGSQSTLVVAGGGTVVELVAFMPSNIVLVDHALSRAFWKGAKGIINVTGEANPEIYEPILSPRPAGEEVEHGHDGDDEHDDELVSESSDESENVTESDADISDGTVSISIPKGAAVPRNADTAYSPNFVTVKKGTTVTWSNDDKVIHTVTSGESDGKSGIRDGLFDSKFMRSGDTFSYTFDETGTFPYYCTPHPWATGVVVVEE